MSYGLLVAVAVLVIVIILVVRQQVAKKKVGSSEVYLYDGPGTYAIEYAQAQKIADKMKAQVATLSQMQAAQKAGAQWCHAGWAKDGTSTVNVYPMQVALKDCGNRIGLVPYGDSTTKSSGLHLYGVKPPKPPNNCMPGHVCIPPWYDNGKQSRWSRYDK